MIRKKDASNDALKQTMSEGAKVGGFHIRVKEVPPALFDVDEIPSLTIEFVGKINIPDELARVKIGKMSLTGEIDEAGKDRIRKLFPNTKVQFDKDRNELYAPLPDEAK